MALGNQVEESLKEAEANLRNALAFAASKSVLLFAHRLLS